MRSRRELRSMLREVPKQRSHKAATRRTWRDDLEDYGVLGLLPVAHRSH